MNLILGLILGAALGVGGLMLITRIRDWLGHSEAGRLRAENHSLQRRLAEKDRHVRRMLSETQRLAEKLGQDKKSQLLAIAPEERENLPLLGEP
ncbi:MAG TPA: hypothetical protein VE082_07415 [Desulfobaccales bacterium]|nr:hypothetical protein [Desulfobaccales bacterium]